MAPANNPRYVIGVFAHVNSGSSTTVPAPTFHDMMTFTLQHFGVPPDGAKAPTFKITGK
jgi:cell division protein FtsI (penicillin-binding protein 3)